MVKEGATPSPGPSRRGSMSAAAVADAARSSGGLGFDGVLDTGVQADELQLWKAVADLDPLLYEEEQPSWSKGKEETKSLIDHERGPAVIHSGRVYLSAIVFPNVDRDLDICSIAKPNLMVTKEAGLARYRHGIRGSRVSKDHAWAAFERKWRKTFKRLAEAGETEGADPASGKMKNADFVVMVRKLILRRLVKVAKQDVSQFYTRDRDEIIVKLRADDSLLKPEADRRDYQMALRPEVDPGYSYFESDDPAERRAAEQRRVRELVPMTRHKLEEGLRSLPIPVGERRIFPNEVLSTATKRYLVWERVVAGYDTTNPFPTYADYSTEDRHQYLFRTYDDGVDETGAERHSILRVVDRLFLQKSVIDRFLDLGKLKEAGFITDYFALHDACRGQKDDLADLASKWLTPRPNLRGNYNAFSKLFMQPLNEIRDYFGEKVALYFAWAAYYTRWLVLPGFVGLAISVVRWSGFYTLEWLAFFCTTIALWTAFFTEYWKQRNRVLALAWGMIGFEAAEDARPEFREKGVRVSRVTLRRERYAPEWIRTAKMAVSYSIIFLCIMVVIGAVSLIFYLRERWTAAYGKLIGGKMASLLNAVEIPILAFLYDKIARRLNDWENHRTDTEFEDNLIFKIFAFQFVNNFASLFYTGFVRPLERHFQCPHGINVDSHLAICRADDDFERLSELLTSIFLVRLMLNAVEIGLPWFKQRQARKSEDAKVKELMKKTKAMRASGMRDVQDFRSSMGPVEREAKLDDYDNTFSDFLELVIQYGYVTLFVAAFPLAPFLALCENILEIKVDAYKLCRLTKRPFPAGAEDIGTWGDIMNIISITAMLTNSALVVFTTGHLHDLPWTTRLLIFLISEHILLIIKMALQQWIPDSPEYVETLIARQSYLVNTYFRGSLDEEDEDDEDEAKSVDGGEHHASSDWHVVHFDDMD